VDLCALQRPLKERYRQEPDAARFTLRASGGEADTPMACSVDLGRAIYQAHTGVGGAGAAACSGDLLLGALAACAQLTCQMVATALGVPVERIEVTVEGDLSALAEKTERYCTVFQTLTQPPPIRTSWREEGVR
jgi:uncharacterized OsmC-like protein